MKAYLKTVQNSDRLRFRVYIAMENPNHKWRFRSLGKSSILWAIYVKQPEGTFFYYDRVPSSSVTVVFGHCHLLGPSDLAAPPLVEVRSPRPLSHGTHVGQGWWKGTYWRGWLGKRKKIMEDPWIKPSSVHTYPDLSSAGSQSPWRVSTWDHLNGNKAGWHSVGISFHHEFPIFPVPKTWVHKFSEENWLTDLLRLDSYNPGHSNERWHAGRWKMRGLRGLHVLLAIWAQLPGCFLCRGCWKVNTAPQQLVLCCLHLKKNLNPYSKALIYG